MNEFREVAAETIPELPCEMRLNTLVIFVKTTSLGKAAFALRSGDIFVYVYGKLSSFDDEVLTIGIGHAECKFMRKEVEGKTLAVGTGDVVP